MIEQNLSPSPISAHRREEEEQNGVGVHAQELCTRGPEDLLWEHEPTLHWVLAISRARHQGQLEHSGRMRLTPLVEDRHAPPVLRRPKTEAAVQEICQQWEECQKDEGGMELFLQKKE